MADIESVRVTAVVEFDLRTGLSKALTLASVEGLFDSVLDKEGSSLAARVSLRAARVKSLTVEDRDG